MSRLHAAATVRKYDPVKSRESAPLRAAIKVIIHAGPCDFKGFRQIAPLGSGRHSDSRMLAENAALAGEG